MAPNISRKSQMRLQDTKLVECTACNGPGTIRDPKTSRAEKCEHCDGEGVGSAPSNVTRTGLLCYSSAAARMLTSGPGEMDGRGAGSENTITR